MDIIKRIKESLVLKKNQCLEWFEMKKERRMEISRNNWKNKANTRATTIRETRKARVIERARINSLLNENKELKQELKKK